MIPLARKLPVARYVDGCQTPEGATCELVAQSLRVAAPREGPRYIPLEEAVRPMTRALGHSPKTPIRRPMSPVRRLIGTR